MAIKILISCRNLYLKFPSYSGDVDFPFSILIVFRSVFKKKKKQKTIVLLLLVDVVTKVTSLAACNLRI